MRPATCWYSLVAVRARPTPGTWRPLLRACPMRCCVMDMSVWSCLWWVCRGWCAGVAGLVGAVDLQEDEPPAGGGEGLQVLLDADDAGEDVAGGGVVDPDRVGAVGRAGDGPDQRVGARRDDDVDLARLGHAARRRVDLRVDLAAEEARPRLARRVRVPVGRRVRQVQHGRV